MEEKIVDPTPGKIYERSKEMKQEKVCESTTDVPMSSINQCMKGILNSFTYCLFLTPLFPFLIFSFSHSSLFVLGLCIHIFICDNAGIPSKHNGFFFYIIKCSDIYTFN